MMKHLKTLVTTTALLLLLAATSETTSLLPLPSITIGQEEDVDQTPLPEESEIQPLADDEDELGITKSD